MTSISMEESCKTLLGDGDRFFNFVRLILFLKFGVADMNYKKKKINSATIG